LKAGAGVIGGFTGCGGGLSEREKNK